MNKLGSWAILFALSGCKWQEQPNIKFCTRKLSRYVFEKEFHIQHKPEVRDSENPVNAETKTDLFYAMKI